MTTSSTQNIPTMTGRTVIVTGANSGIGRATAKALAAKGARVVLAVRQYRQGSRRRVADKRKRVDQRIGDGLVGRLVILAASIEPGPL